MKKHILSKKCWCKPDVISFRKENEDNLSDKILKIAALFNDSMDNDKYNRIRKILESFQMEIEVETGLKNFQVTTKELADARKEVIIKIKNWALRSLTHGNFEDTDILNELLDVLATLREKEEPKKEKHGCCQCYCSMCRDMCFRSKCVVHTKEETK